MLEVLVLVVALGQWPVGMPHRSQRGVLASFWVGARDGPLDALWFSPDERTPRQVLFAATRPRASCRRWPRSRASLLKAPVPGSAPTLSRFAPAGTWSSVLSHRGDWRSA